jgi:hypothetical protein
VLSYVLAGLQRQRLVVLMTYRDEQLPEGDALHGWLADVRRFPVVQDLALARLDRAETAEQAALALGEEPDPELVAELVARTGGNAYFNELLLREVDPDSGRLPERTPDALRAALLARWHALPAAARETSRLLAVSGRPVSSGVLARAAAAIGVSPGDVSGALRSAADAGVLQLGAETWFRHPLMAEAHRPPPRAWSCPRRPHRAPGMPMASRQQRRPGRRRARPAPRSGRRTLSIPRRPGSAWAPLCRNLGEQAPNLGSTAPQSEGRFPMCDPPLSEQPRRCPHHPLPRRTS